ncbi:MAG: PAS domain-containing protein [Candidatus Obscuribacterales bacterium]|nr:PAS domain-containing protein [Cyanobacteria bacterium HKST-UBA01]MCB9469185.1 PAS domain-containing protein [Candidatus Obscuribacterales bacterium]
MDIIRDLEDKQKNLISYIGKAIKARRQEIAMTQEDLAFDADMARNYVTELESGKRSFSIKNLYKLASALKVMPSVLIRNAEKAMLSEQIEDESFNSTDIFDQDMQFLEYSMNASGLSFVITDPGQKDNPIIYCNKNFEVSTGYGREDIIGKNCRFLQGELKEQDEIEKIREAIFEVKPTIVQLKNFKKDGTPFTNQLALSPLFDEAGELMHFMGVQTCL